MGKYEKIAMAIRNRFALKAERGAIGVGLIGLSGWGATNAVNIMQSRRFSIRTIYDIQKEPTECFSKRYGVRACGCAEEVFNCPTIQAVCITVPNHHHMTLVRAAADAGKHIFIEKPLASLSKDCLAIGKHCEEKGVVLQVGHQMRREPIFREIKDRIDGNDWGPLLFVQGVHTLDRQYRDDWRHNADACPGGSMEQLGVHLLDALVYLLGTPMASQGWSRNIPRLSDAPDWGSVTLTFSGNVRATICTSFSSPGSMKLELFFPKGCLITDGKCFWFVSKKGRGKSFKPRGVRGSLSQFIEFADCIEFGKRPETGAAESAVVMAAVQSMLPLEGVPHHE